MSRLYGKRIMLREYKKDDIYEIRKWVNNPNIVDNLSDIFMYPHTLNETERFVNSKLEDTSETKGFVIAHKEDEGYIGQLDFIRVDWKNRTAEIGIVIGSEENHRKGYGTEAIQLMQDFAFNRMNLNKLELRVHIYNIKAYKCYLKCGFVEEGRIRQNFYINGKYTDTIYMGILKSEYEQIKLHGKM